MDTYVCIDLYTHMYICAELEGVLRYEVLPRQTRIANGVHACHQKDKRAELNRHGDTFGPASKHQESLKGLYKGRHI